MELIRGVAVWDYIGPSLLKEVTATSQGAEDTASNVSSVLHNRDKLSVS